MFNPELSPHCSGFLFACDLSAVRCALKKICSRIKPSLTDCRASRCRFHHKKSHSMSGFLVNADQYRSSRVGRRRMVRMNESACSIRVAVARRCLSREAWRGVRDVDASAVVRVVPLAAVAVDGRGSGAAEGVRRRSSRGIRMSVAAVRPRGSTGGAGMRG